MVYITTLLQAAGHVRFGSSAAPRHPISSVAAIGCIPAVPQRIFKIQNLNVCSCRKRSFKPLEKRCCELPQTAKIGLRGSKKCTCAGRRAIPSPAEPTHRLLGRALPADVIPEPLAGCRRCQFRSPIALGVTSSTIRSRPRVTPHQPRLLTAWLS